MAYFVTYQFQVGSSPRTDCFNIILVHKHPIEWAAERTLLLQGEKLVTYILFWAEIPDNLISIASSWCLSDDAPSEL